MKILQRIKRFWKLWKLSAYQDVFIVKEKMSDEQLQALAKSLPGGEIVAAPEELPDGKAVFIGEGTHDDFIEQQRADEGLKPWYDRIKNL